MMQELYALWLPILVCGVALFFASFIAWAVSPHHKPDWRRVPDTEGLQRFVREHGVAPGQYIFPYMDDPSKLKDPEFKARFEAGPLGTLTVWPSAPNMPRNMALTVLYFLCVSFLIAYLCAVTLDPGATFAKVFQVAGTAGILAYCAAHVCNSIWFWRPLRAILTDLLDGVVYGLITGAIFAVFWPAA